MATIVAATGAAGNWTSGGAWVGGVAPTAADDAQITSLTTSITIDAGAVCRSADFSTFTGTLTQGSTGTLTIGDATAGLSSIALKMPSGFTYVPNTASTISFISTSATQQTVSINSSYTMAALTFNSTSNGNYAITANLTQGAARTLTLTKGTLHFDGTADNSGLTHTLGNFVGNTSTQTIYLGTANITWAGTSFQVGAAGNITMNAGTSSMTMSGAAFLFQTGALTFYDVAMTGSGQAQVDASGGNVTFHNFTRTGTAAKTDGISFNYTSAGTQYTATNQWNLNGNSFGNRLFVKSGTLGSAPKWTTTGTTLSITYCDFRDINSQQAVDLSAVTGLAGDCQGNTNITFAAGVTQYYQTAVSSNWSDTTKWFLGSNGTGGAGRIPLAQDPCIFDAFSVTTSGKTISGDMPRCAKSWDCTGLANNPAFSWGNLNCTWYGSVTLVSGMSHNTNNHRFEARGAASYTTGGCTTAMGFAVDMTSAGTLTMQDAITTPGSINITTGTFNSNGFNITAIFMALGASATTTITNSTITLSNAGTSPWSGAGTLTATGSTIIFTDTSSATKTFAGGGKTYGTFKITTSAGVGLVNITGGNTFSAIAFVGTTAQTVQFSAGTTTTLTLGNLALAGGTNAAKLITYKSITDASAWTLSSGTTLDTDFISLRDCTGAGVGKNHKAGTNSTNVSGNTFWDFTNPFSGTPGVATFNLPTVTVVIGTGSTNATVAPNALTMAAALQSPTLINTLLVSNINSTFNLPTTNEIDTILPSVLAGTFNLPSTSQPNTVLTNVSNGAFSLQAPSLINAKTVLVSPVESLFSVQSPLIQNTNIVAPVQGTFALQSPLITAGGNITVLANPLTSTFTLQAVSINSSPIIIVNVLTGAFALQAPSIVLLKTVSVSVLQSTFSLQNPTYNITSSTTISVAPNLGTFTLNSPTILISSTFSPSVLGISAALQSTLLSRVIINPGAFAITGSVQTNLIKVTINPNSLTSLMTLQQHLVSIVGITNATILMNVLTASLQLNTVLAHEVIRKNRFNVAKHYENRRTTKHQLVS